MADALTLTEPVGSELAMSWVGNDDGLYKGMKAERPLSHSVYDLVQLGSIIKLFKSECCTRTI